MLVGAVLKTSGLACLLAASACTVYAPMQPVVPLVRQRGDKEARASPQPSGRLEAHAAYSPLPHCVVLGAGTGAAQPDRQNCLITRQAHIGKMLIYTRYHV